MMNPRSSMLATRGNVISTVLMESVTLIPQAPTLQHDMQLVQRETPLLTCYLFYYWPFDTTGAGSHLAQMEHTGIQ